MAMALPIPELDDRTFDQLVQEARSLISRYTSEWTDHNVHDPGISFIELFAWLAEMQIYQLNRVSDKNYKKFLKLVKLDPGSSQPARVDITFENVTDEKVIEAGTQVKTDVGEEQIVFEVEEDFTLVPVSLKSVITVSDSKITDNTQANEKEGVYFAPFGEKAVMGGRFLLGFDNPLPEKEIQITFVLFEEDLASVGRHGEKEPQVSPSVDVEWEYLNRGEWRGLTIKRDSTLALARSGRVVFDGPSLDPKDGLYWIRCRFKEGRYEIIPQINRILLNTISAVQIETIKSEYLGTGVGIPEQKVHLKKTPIIPHSQKIQVQKDAGEWEDWVEGDDFEQSGPDDPHYRFDPEKGEITFGNGLNGHIPLESQSIRAFMYQTTLGPRGNIPRGQKFRINKVGFEGILGKNLQEAKGGQAAESVDDAKARARKDFRTRYRAITSNDYEYLAVSTPGLRLARAKAIANYHPNIPCIPVPGTVTIVVVPHARDETITSVPGEGFVQTISRHLDMHRLVTTDLHVIGPEYVEISVQCKVYIEKGSSPTDTEERVRNKLEEFLDPLKGGLDKMGWPFGRSVYPSEIYQILDEVEGVDYATDVFLSADGQYERVGDIIQIPPVGLIFSGHHDLEMK